MTDRMQTVQGRCPACRGASLFLGDDGHVTCSRLECPKPEAADELLHGDFVTKSTNALLSSRVVASAAVYNGALVRALNAEGAVAEVREYAATSDDDGIRTRENILRIVGDWPGPETAPESAAAPQVTNGWTLQADGTWTLSIKVGHRCHAVFHADAFSTLRYRAQFARIAKTVSPILEEWPEHNRIDEHEHVVGEITAAVLSAIQGDWTPPPPGDRREQLPDDILALINIPPYTSTACETAELLAAAVAAHPEHATELRQWETRQRQRCRTNNKFTGARCGCHGKRPDA